MKTSLVIAAAGIVILMCCSPMRAIASDEEFPTILSVTPSDGSLNVSRTQCFEFTFSEPMNQFSVLGNSCNGELTNTNWSDDATVLTACFEFITSGPCQLIINNSGYMKDLSGNALDKTEVDFTITGPLVAPTADLFEGTVPLTINFSSLVADGVAPYHFDWDFGDGSHSNDQNPTHQFLETGLYTVTLTVTDAKEEVTKVSLFIRVLHHFNVASSCSDITDDPSVDELLLAELINEYRSSMGLHTIGISRSLSRVARYHCQDMEDSPAEGGCNAHSWSNQGPWSGCCYTPDHAQAACMWSKPNELTPFNGNGYEIGYTFADSFVSTTMDPEIAFTGWKNSSAHNAVITNQAPWVNFPWQSMGVGLFRGSAAVWFAVESDPCGYHTPLPETVPQTVPILNVTVEGTRAELNWTLNSDADGTIFYWVFMDGKGNPDLSTLGSADMGTMTRVESDFESGFSILTAVLPYNKRGTGTISNIVPLRIP